MSTLRVILDDMVNPAAGRLARYTEELTRALIAVAPRGTTVSGIVSASPPDDYNRISDALPRLEQLHKSALARRELTAAWQHGFTRIPGSGFLHATSLLAPLRRHDRVLDASSQTVVTIHDAIAWTHPELLSGRSAGWHRTMGKRAERFADAVVVPTHAVADELADFLTFGDRVRVIGSAPAAPALDVSGVEVELPDRFVTTTVEHDPENGFRALFDAVAALGDVPIVVLSDGVSEEAVRAALALAGLEGRSMILLDPDDVARTIVLQRAAVYVQPSIAAGFGAPMLDAMAAGAAVVHSDAPSLVEVAAGAGTEVPRGDVDALTDAIRHILDDEAERDRLRVLSGDRAKAFLWRDAAEKVWQLHADL